MKTLVVTLSMLLLSRPALAQSRSSGSGSSVSSGSGSEVMASCGPPSLLCSLTTTGVSALNSPPPLPAAGGMFLDPYTGMRMLRLSDQTVECNINVSTQSQCSGNNYANGNVQSSSDLNPWSVPNADSDQTYDICTHTDGNSMVLFNFDPVTFTSARIDNLNGKPGSTGTNVPSDGDGSCEFSHSTPRTLYAIKSGSSTSAPLMEKFSYSYSGAPPVTWNAPVQRLDPNMCYFDTQNGHVGQGAFLPAQNGPPASFTATASTAAGSLPADTYYVDVVIYESTPYVNPVTSQGGTAILETTPAHEATVVLSGTGEILVSNVATPSNLSNVLGYRVYVGTNPGWVALQAETPVANWAAQPTTTIAGPLQMYYNGSVGGMIGQNCRASGTSGVPNWGDGGPSTGCGLSGRDLSADDTRQLMNIGGISQDTQYAEIIYDSTKDQHDGIHAGCRWYNTLLGETGGDWGPAGNATNQLQAATAWNGGTGITLPGTSHYGLNPTSGNAYGYFVHGLNFSKSGKLAIITPDGDSGVPYNALTNIEAGETPTQSIAEMIWQIDTSNVAPLGGQSNCPAGDTGIACNFGGHLSMGWNDQADSGGQGFAVYRYHVFNSTAVRGSNSDNGCVPPTYCMSNRINMNPNSSLANGVTLGQHSSFQQFSAASTPPIFVSYDNENNTPFAAPWQGEIVGDESVGCATGSCTGLVHRFAHDWSIGDLIGGFAHCARGAASQDDQYFIFASGWIGNQSVNGGIAPPSTPTAGVTSGGTITGTYYVAVSYTTPAVVATGGVAEYGGETTISGYVSVNPSTQAVTINYPATTAPKNSGCNCNQATGWSVYMSTDHSNWHLQTYVSGFGSGVGATVTAYNSGGAAPSVQNTTGSRPQTPLGTTANGSSDSKCQIFPNVAQASCRLDVMLVSLR